MAAPQWSGGKWKTIQEAKAQFGHSITSRRKAAQHTNLHIDKSLTEYNFTYRGLDYKQCCDAYDKRMAEIDQGRPGSGKNARTIMQSVILYPPAALAGNRDKLRDWFEKAGKLAEDRFGADLIDIAVHFDEVHTYTDPETKEERTSREHAHMWLVPEVAGKLNGKKFSSREVITGFNDELQAMSIKEFGCPMMDGSKAKGGRKVEDMKAASQATEIIAQAEKQAQETARDLVEAAEQQAREIMAKAQEAAQKTAQKAEKRLKLAEDHYKTSQEREKIAVSADINLSVDLKQAKELITRLQEKHDQANQLLAELEAEKMAEQKAKLEEQQAAIEKGKKTVARITKWSSETKVKDLQSIPLPPLPLQVTDNGPEYSG